MNVVVGARQARSDGTERITNPQLEQGGGRTISTIASHRDQDGEGGDGLCDGLL